MPMLLIACGLIVSACATALPQSAVLPERPCIQAFVTETTVDQARMWYGQSEPGDALISGWCLRSQSDALQVEILRLAH